jgi:hypothetical protein
VVQVVDCSARIGPWQQGSVLVEPRLDGFLRRRHATHEGSATTPAIIAVAAKLMKLLRASRASIMVTPSGSISRRTRHETRPPMATVLSCACSQVFSSSTLGRAHGGEYACRVVAVGVGEHRQEVPADPGQSHVVTQKEAGWADGGERVRLAHVEEGAGITPSPGEEV